MKKYIYGIDIGGTTIKIGLFNLSGVLLEKWEIPTNRNNNGENVLKDIYNSIKEETNDLQAIKGFGFGVPGPVTDGIVYRCVNIGWDIVDVEKEFKKYVGDIHIVVGNDANIACAGEAWKGGAAGYKDVVMITLGTGVGGGILHNGELISGADGAGGEIGHMILEKNSKNKCNCGRFGCLETYTSATAISKLTSSYLKNSNIRSSLRNEKKINSKAVFDAAKKGDELALKVVDETCDYLGYATSIICATMNPKVVVFGGGVSKAGEFLIEKIRDNFNKYAFSAVKNTKIVQAELGNDSGIYGAASLIEKL